MSEKEFDKTLKLTNYALIMSGIKTSENDMNKTLEYFINHYLFYCNAIALHTVIFGEVYWIVDGIRTNHPFVELSLVSPCATISILSTIKCGFIFSNKGILMRVVHKLKEIHTSFDDNELSKESAPRTKIVTDSLKLLQFVQISFATIYIFVFFSFCFIPVILAEYNYYRTGEFVVTYPFFVKYPFDFDVHHCPAWQLIYFHQVWATAIVIMSMFGCDSLFYGLCVYIKTHFQLLGLRFENIVGATKSETQRNLAKAVVRHQELIDLVNQMELLYSKSSLVNIITSSILICLSAFNITVVDKLNVILAFVTFLVMSLSQISLVCYFADLLMAASMEISGSVYRSPWYEADNHSKKILLLVIMRSQKACKLTAWNFADLNLGAFTTILSRSWSYFALLKTVYK
nr:odorant receptor 67c [Helicoverpa armigera]